jgi:hypothetical protein
MEGKQTATRSVGPRVASFDGNRQRVQQHGSESTAQPILGLSTARNGESQLEATETPLQTSVAEFNLKRRKDKANSSAKSA